MVTNIPYPCCGMTRAFCSVLLGHFTKAFTFHALF
ncbi:DUF2752 domain-containing protein [Pseudolactococcus chungangensis]